MELFGGVISVTGITFLLLSVMAVTAAGYLLGRIRIKGVSLGAAGVFVVALLFGGFFYRDISAALTVSGVSYATQALKLVESIGLVFFVASVGFISGPKFFKNLRMNFKSYALLAVVIILSGSLACVLCFFIGRGFESDRTEFAAMLDGILSGALTSTPGFSAAKATAENLFTGDPARAEACEAAVTAGHGIAYIFGVIGKVLFVQLVPKFAKADMAEERKKLVSADGGERKPYNGKLLTVDGLGLAAFALAVGLGIVVGAVRIPLTGRGFDGATFSLTTTGGTLIAALVLGHFGRIGPVSITPSKKLLETLRELGLVLFLIGAGISGGARFVEYFKAVYFLYGIFMTIVPMIVGYFFAKHVLKLSLLNNLGAITGGMTSTPALGTLIEVSGTEEVVSAYAATYPVSLLTIVFVSQILLLLLG